jgi:small subunit ribosomal protein S17
VSEVQKVDAGGTVAGGPGAGGAGGKPRAVRATVLGEVVSDLMKKTVVVSETRSVRHAKYGKFINRTTRYYAHDEDEKAKVGDVVEIEQTRPMSRLKRWRLVRIVRASQGRVRGEKDMPVPGLESEEAAK